MKARSGRSRAGTACRPARWPWSCSPHGGTYDIGLQALSGALERGHRFLCLLRQRGVHEHGRAAFGATPFGASTTTSPAGLESFGKAQKRKDMTAIAVGHHVPYVAQAVATHWHDLSRKVSAAVAADGPSFLNVLTDCPVGWGHEPRLMPRVLNAAVDSTTGRCTRS